MFVWIAGVISAVLKIVSNITDRQKAYLDWRLSDEGRKHFKREEDNAFWKALVSGDTSVIDAGIKDRQSRIDELKRATGLCVLAMLLTLFTAGCGTPFSIPKSTPMLVPEALTTGETTYVGHNVKIVTPTGETKVLEGNWHFVSTDFMRDHVNNQDDLIKALEAVQAEKTRKERAVYVSAGAAVVMAIVALFVGTRIASHA